MKDLRILILFFFALSSCGGDDGSDIPAKNNSSPTIPNLSYPSNNLVCIDNNINFQWDASSDVDKDDISYTLEIATNSTFTENYKSASTNLTNKEYTLDKGKLYYWRVKAKDDKNASSDFSSVYTFYTESAGIVNHVPFAPVLSSPQLNSVQSGNSIELIWTASDADSNDSLVYDLFFSNSNPPSDKIASDLTSSSFTTDITSKGEYYWKIVAKDGHGGTTVGQIWHFSKQ